MRAVDHSVSTFLKRQVLKTTVEAVVELNVAKNLKTPGIRGIGVVGLIVNEGSFIPSLSRMTVYLKAEHSADQTAAKLVLNKLENLILKDIRHSDRGPNRGLLRSRPAEHDH